jgi:phosphate transport system permease protein
MPVSVPPAPPAAATRPRWSARRLALFDSAFKLVCQFCAALVIVIAIALVTVLIWRSWLAISTNSLEFFKRSPDEESDSWFQTRWRPEGNPPIFGAMPYVFGTVVTSLIAMALALPLGIGTAAYLSEIAGARVRRVVSFFIEMLAAIPSVVYGFWGLLVLAPHMQKVYTWMGGPNVGGQGLLTAGIILAIMIVPYIAAISFDVCQAVPRAQREGSLALGATRWQTIWSVVLPYARPGIIAGAFLALGRALGETMAVTMLIGNKGEISFSPYAAGSSIPSILATQYNEASGDLWRSVLVELALLLLLVTVVINSLARWLLWRVGRVSRAETRRPAALPDGTPSADGQPALSLTPAPAPPPRPVAPLRPEPSWLSAQAVNRVMTGLMGSCVAVTMGLLLVILAFLLQHGLAALDWDFFTKLPGGTTETHGVGLAHAIVGSCKIVGYATLFAVPIGLLAAIYLAEYQPTPLARSTRFIAELIAGVPSIIVGLFAAVVFDFITFLLDKKFGIGMRFYGWSGVFALAVMMVPIVIRASEEALKLVPRPLRDASLALGSSHAQMVLRVTLPAALSAVVTGIFLSIARIAGETAPLLMTTGTSNKWPKSLNGFTPNLPYYIYQYGRSGVEQLERQAWAAAFVLMVVILLLNFGIRLVTGKRLVLAGHAG